MEFVAWTQSFRPQKASLGLVGIIKGVSLIRRGILYAPRSRCRTGHSICHLKNINKGMNVAKNMSIR
jgi:hypothetical protein